MSIGHLAYEKKSREEIYKTLGGADTPKLYARKLKPVDHSRLIPYGGGISVDGRQPYIDSWLYDQVMSGRVRVRGISASQIIDRWIDHEHTEKTVIDGDNPVDSYQPAHEIATGKEEEGVDDIGRSPALYEDDIAPALRQCLRRALRLIGTNDFNPPTDLWCEPYLDKPDKDDLRLLAAMRACGVVDAFKASKIEAHYGIGPEECRDCKHLEPGRGALRPCRKLSGLVRLNRHCDWWQSSKG